MDFGRFPFLPQKPFIHKKDPAPKKCNRLHILSNFLHLGAVWEQESILPKIIGSDFSIDFKQVVSAEGLAVELQWFHCKSKPEK
ncbi:MAG: hypothetical protein IID18_10410 [Nitrospinae bacterium]|nr:hypothetical protein [Nitrospinota bacterium]